MCCAKQNTYVARVQEKVMPIRSSSYWTITTKLHATKNFDIKLSIAIHRVQRYNNRNCNFKHLFKDYSHKYVLLAVTWPPFVPVLLSMKDG